MTKSEWIKYWLEQSSDDLLAGYPVRIDGATVVQPLDFYLALLLAYDAKREADNHFQADREALLLGAVLNDRGDPAESHLFAVMGGRDEVLSIAKAQCEPHADKAYAQFLVEQEDDRAWEEHQRRKDAA